MTVLVPVEYSDYHAQIVVVSKSKSACMNPLELKNADSMVFTWPATRTKIVWSIGKSVRWAVLSKNIFGTFLSTAGAKPMSPQYSVWSFPIRTTVLWHCPELYIVLEIYGFNADRLLRCYSNLDDLIVMNVITGRRMQCREYRFHIQKRNVKFIKLSVKYLGHVILNLHSFQL